MICGGFIIGLVKGWLFTLIIIGMTPLIFLAMALFLKYELKGAEVFKEAFAQAGAVSDETFTFIKNVKSLNGEAHQYSLFEKACNDAKKGMINFGFKASFFFGLFFGTIFVSYALSFLLGSRLIYWNTYNHNESKDYDVGSILTIFFSVITGVFGFSSLGPVLKAVQEGRIAMGKVLNLMNTQHGETSGSLKPEKIRGEIEFCNVTFSYPTKKHVKVLKNVSFKIEPGSKAALVGPSGCGKSTCIQLILRYYDPDEGEILLDGVNIQDYDLKWLREKLGLVSQ